MTAVPAALRSASDFGTTRRVRNFQTTRAKKSSPRNNDTNKSVRCLGVPFISFVAKIRSARGTNLGL